MNPTVITLAPLNQMAHRVMAVVPSMHSLSLADLVACLSYQRIFGSELLIGLECWPSPEDRPASPQEVASFCCLLLLVGLDARRTRVFSARRLLDAHRLVVELLADAESDGNSNGDDIGIQLQAVVALLQPWLTHFPVGYRASARADQTCADFARWSERFGRDFHVMAPDREVPASPSPGFARFATGRTLAEDPDAFSMLLDRLTDPEWVRERLVAEGPLTRPDEVTLTFAKAISVRARSVRGLDRASIWSAASAAFETGCARAQALASRHEAYVRRVLAN